MPKLQVRSLVGHAWEATNRYFFLTSMFLSLPNQKANPRVRIKKGKKEEISYANMAASKLLGVLHILSLSPKEMSDVHERKISKGDPKVPQNIFKPLENILFCTALSLIAIQTRKQPTDGNDIQLGWRILSFGILTNRLTFSAFDTHVASLREYVLMHHTKRGVQCRYRDQVRKDKVLPNTPLALQPGAGCLQLPRSQIYSQEAALAHLKVSSLIIICLGKIFKQGNYLITKYLSSQRGGV